MTRYLRILDDAAYPFSSELTRKRLFSFSNEAGASFLYEPDDDTRLQEIQALKKLVKLLEADHDKSIAEDK